MAEKSIGEFAAPTAVPAPGFPPTTEGVAAAVPQAARVTRINDYLSRDTVEALRDLLRRAEAGQIRAVGFVFKTGPRRHRIGFTGDYLDDPMQALGCTARMGYKLNQLMSARDGEPETQSMPL